MELLLAVCFQILSFDSLVTSLAKGSVKLVIMLLAIRKVIYNVEICRLKWCAACLANKTLFMVAASKATVSGFDGFAYYRLRTTSTFPFTGSRSTSFHSRARRSRG